MCNLCNAEIFFTSLLFCAVPSIVELTHFPALRRGTRGFGSSAQNERSQKDVHSVGPRGGYNEISWKCQINYSYAFRLKKMREGPFIRGEFPFQASLFAHAPEICRASEKKDILARLFSDTYAIKKWRLLFCIYYTVLCTKHKTRILLPRQTPVLCDRIFSLPTSTSFDVTTLHPKKKFNTWKKKRKTKLFIVRFACQSKIFDYYPFPVDSDLAILKYREHVRYIILLRVVYIMRAHSRSYIRQNIYSHAIIHGIVSINS